MFLVSSLRNLFHLFFPRICPGCHRQLAVSEEVVCLICLSDLPRTTFHLYQDNPAYRRFEGRVNIEFAVALFYSHRSSLFKTLLYQLKYKGCKHVGHFLGGELGRNLQEVSHQLLKADLLIPVPLHPKRERVRGFNQSLEIAKGLSEVTRIPCDSTILQRRAFSRSQTGKSRHERWENVKDQFEVKTKKDLDNLHIIIVDDVMTTGATLEACVNALQKSAHVRISFALLGYSAT